MIASPMVADPPDLSGRERIIPPVRRANISGSDAGAEARSADGRISRRDASRAGLVIPALVVPLPSARGPLGSGQAVTLAFARDTDFLDRLDTEGGADYNGGPVLAVQLAADSWVRTHVVHGTPVPESDEVAAADLETWAERRTCSAIMP